jgi:hypothetical protein
MVLATMSTLRTTCSVREARRPARAFPLGTLNDKSPILGHSAPPGVAPALRRYPPGPSRISFRKPHNQKEIPPHLGVTVSKRPSLSRPLNINLPNEPSPIFGHSTPTPIKPAKPSPLPPPLPLTSCQPKTPKLRAISKSPRLRVEDPLSPPPELYFRSKLSILGRFGSFRVRCLKSGLLLQARPR